MQRASSCQSHTIHLNFFVDARPAGGKLQHALYPGRNSPKLWAAISNKSVQLLPGKIQVPALRVRAHQSYLKLIAHIHTLLTTSEKSFCRRI
jgi:hypothetical protein